MAIKKISELVAASALVPADSLVVVQDGVTKKASVAQMITAVDQEYVSQTEFDEQGPSGRELAYAEVDSNQSGIAATHTDVIGLTINFTVANRPVYVTADIALLFAVTNPATALVYLADQTNDSKRAKTVALTSTTVTGNSCILTERINTPGTYTRKVRVVRSGGTGTISLGFPGLDIYSHIKAVEA